MQNVEDIVDFNEKNKEKAMPNRPLSLFDLSKQNIVTGILVVFVVVLTC